MNFWCLNKINLIKEIDRVGERGTEGIEEEVKGIGKEIN